MSTIGKTYYETYSDLLSKDKIETRKVAGNSNGEYVVSEGDKSAFKTADSEMGKDQFLKLLVAQLQHQDPMNPAEDTQFVAQLAQFSQLEFTQNSTAAISQLASSMQNFMEMQTLQAQSITNASATPLINKMVRVMEDSFEYSGTSGKDINIHLNEGNKNARVLIKNADGDVVADLGVSIDSSKGGDGVVKWDGKDPETGNPYLGGKYTIEVVNVSGQKMAGYAYSEGVVTAVNFNSSGAALTINGKQYGLGFLVNVEDYEAPPKKAEEKKEEDEVEHVAGGGFD